jgi:hypothetical protein
VLQKATEPAFSASEIAQELEREVRMRERVYPRQVEEGKMSQPLADRRLAIMAAAAADYRAEAEAKEPRLL